MDILHVIRSLDPDQGGSSVVAASLAAAQASQGNSVALAFHESATNARALAQLLETVPNHAQLMFHPIPLKNRLPLAIPELSRRLMDIVRGRDIIHLHGVWDPILHVAANAADKLGIPHVVTPHGLLDPWCLGQKRLKKLAALRLYAANTLSTAHFIHTLTRDEAKAVHGLNLTNRVVVIPNGLFREALRQMGGPGPDDLALRRDGRQYVLFLGRLHFKKGLDILAQAFAIAARAAPEADLVVVGPDEGALPSFLKAVAENGLSERVRIAGPLYGEAKYAALRGAACFCLPSRQEGFSMAVLEALGCGTPVVLSLACNFPEVDAVGAGMSKTLSPQPLAEALGAYLSSPELRQRAGQAGRSLVAERYTWEVIAADMIAAYRTGEAPACGS